tara:strand:- start:11383 stop:11859 length:477 start_codon:yes stop_codon:yes gene_type:complete
MSFDSPSFDAFDNINYKKIRIGIVRSLWNKEITDLLYQSSYNFLKNVGLEDQKILTKNVPGSMELIHGSNTILNNNKDIDGIIALGCIIKGETDHDKYISYAVANGLVNVSLKYNKPIIFGVLTTNNMSQAIDRCGGKHGDKGLESAKSLLMMINNAN